MRFTLVLVLLAAIARADEIQTKDGKKIEFKSLIDEGDTLELTTPQGTKVSVKKADFDKYIPSGVKDVPLTGAAFAFDKKRKLESIDLLGKIDVKRDQLVPEWRLASGLLTGKSGPDAPGKLQIPYTPPEEYDLTIVVEMKDRGGLYLGLIGGGRQFNFALGQGWSGPDLIDGKGATETGLAIQGDFFAKGPRTVTVMVRKEALIVQADGKDYWTWKPAWDHVSVSNWASVNSKNTLFLAIWKATVSIQKLTITTPKEKP